MTSTSNFLLAKIPEIGDFEVVFAELASPPDHREEERLLSPVQRRRIVARRLSNYFFPGWRHLRLYEGIIGQIRDGYEGRARTMAEHERRIREVSVLHGNGELITPADVPAVQFTTKAVGLNNTSRSSILLGTPGGGKTLTVEEILRRVPEVIQHRDGARFDQVGWIKIDCPHKSSIKSLCIDFFADMDRILGFPEPHYTQMYAAMKSTE